MNWPTITPILTIEKETHDIKTIFFRYKESVHPGQFFMIWIPKIDEIPMSVSHISSDEKAITFRKVGDATSALFHKKVNDLIGIRGPFGNGFKLNAQRPLYVGGGTGIAMLLPAILDDLKNNKHVTVILGAKTKKDLLFKDKIKKQVQGFFITTDDGSEGYQGFASDLSKELIEKNDFDGIFTCGPEPMMKNLYLQSKTIPFQASLERYMKCGMGLCGHCSIGNGHRVCVEGPIFQRKTLEKIKEFGKYKRDASGRKISL
jgi:dihydroorotate dehydrogenase electron transfer subunit